jgi:NAD+ diphosphatase
MRYPSTVNLPFNHDTVRGQFLPLMPGAEQPAGDGWWVIIQGNALLVVETDAVPTLPYGVLPAGLQLTAEPFCIGTWQGKPLRLGALSRGLDLPAGLVAEPFNASGDRLDDATLTLGGIGMQILHWRQQSHFCSRCGATLTPLSGNWGRRCSDCNYEHFPAIHPCAIILVRRGAEFLLVRKKEWQPGRYGLVAGFLDMGESLEECAVREVQEETGISVTNVRYVGSQCWPFPSQLMAGFVADFAGGEIKVAQDELEDARWFSLEEMPAALPPRRSIARWILDHHLL